LNHLNYNLSDTSDSLLAWRHSCFGLVAGSSNNGTLGLVIRCWVAFQGKNCGKN